MKMFNLKFLLIIINTFCIVFGKYSTSIKNSILEPSFLISQSQKSYLIGEKIIIKADLIDLINLNGLKVYLNGTSNKPITDLIECLDCEPYIFNNKTKEYPKTLYFTYRAKSASKVLLFLKFELDIKELKNNKTNFLEIDIIKSKEISIFANIIGWLYFFCWFICFYPQVYLNFKNKSCVGLNLDYVVLNFIGFISYAIFNFSIYYVDCVRDEYQKVYPYSNIPVLFNDLIFSLHHAVITFIIVLQCALIYPNGNQKFTKPLIISTTAVVSGGTILGFYLLLNKFSLLDFIYFFSYVKMIFTAFKFIPQVYSNYINKSTNGWSVSYNFWDIFGGSFCMIQVFLLIYNYEDWSFISKNLAKTGIALLTILFDLIFITQHFCLYSNTNKSQSDKLNLSKLNLNDESNFKKSKSNDDFNNNSI